jgi:hypothetical protein
VSERTPAPGPAPAPQTPVLTVNHAPILAPQLAATNQMCTTFGQDWDTASDDDDCSRDPSYHSRRGGSASAGSPSVRTRRSQGGSGRSRRGAGLGACGEAGRGESCSPPVTSPLPSSPMPPAETWRETFPAALPAKGKEPADDNDSRITANAAAAADTDLLADADAAAGSRDSEEIEDVYITPPELRSGGADADKRSPDASTLTVSSEGCVESIMGPEASGADKASAEGGDSGVGSRRAGVSGKIEDGGRGAAESMGVVSLLVIRTASHAAMMAVLCVDTFSCGAIHVHTYFTLASTGMLTCVYGVA